MARYTSNVSSSSLVEKAQLTIEDVQCPICLFILIEPVTLPSCKHSFCHECYLNHTQKTSLCCPLCRKRISLRNAQKNNKLLDKDLWSRVKKEFSGSIWARQNGEDQAQRAVQGRVTCSSRGAIFYEFRRLNRELEKQFVKQRLNEELASAAVAKQLEDEKRERIKLERKRKRERKRIEKEDFVLAKKLHKVLNKVQVEPRPKSVRKKTPNKKYSPEFL